MNKRAETMNFDEWKDDYGLVYEPNYSEATEKDCRAAWHARDAEIAELKVVSDHNLATYHKAAQKLREQVTLLRNVIDSASQIITFEGVPYYLLGLEERDESLAATEEN